MLDAEAVDVELEVRHDLGDRVHLELTFAEQAERDETVADEAVRALFDVRERADLETDAEVQRVGLAEVEADAEVQPKSNKDESPNKANG